MNLVDLMRGIASGYVVRLLQILATVLVIPFLLRQDVLGIENYGGCVSMIAAFGLISMVTDGLRVSYSRSIAQAISASPAAIAVSVGSGLKVMLLLLASLALALFAIRGWLLGILGLPATDEWRLALALAAAAALAENLFHLFQSYALARGRLDVVNGVVAGEVILRNMLFVGIFSSVVASPSIYMAIVAGAVLLRGFCFVGFALWRFPGDFKGLLAAPMKESMDALRYSVAVSGASLQFFVIQRMSIPLVNRFVGSAEAGLLAIALNTITNNASQVLFSVVRPILVPIASRFRYNDLSTSARRVLHEVDCLYAFIVALVMVPLVAVLPSIIELWLGADFEQMAMPAQILVAGAAVQVSFNVRRSVLIGQGKARTVAQISVVIAVLAALGLLWATAWAESWQWAAFVIACSAAMNGLIAHGWVFESGLLSGDSPGVGATWRRMLGVAIGLACAIGIGWATPLSSWMAIPAFVAAFALMVGFGHMLLIQIGDVVGLIKRMRASSHRSFFDVGDHGSERESGAPV